MTGVATLPGHSPLPRALVVRNVVLYEIGWLATALGAAGHHAWLGLAVTVPIVALHLVAARDPAREAQLLVAVTLLGAGFDAALTACGWIAFRDPGFVPGLQPWWMIALWLQFATTLNVSLRWLRGHAFWAAALAALGGPLAYWGGERIGAVDLAAPGQAVTALALGWPVVILAALALSRRFDGFVHAPVRSGRSSA